MSSQVFGNLIAGETLGALPEIYYFIIMIVITGFATLSFVFIREPEYI